MTTTSTSTLSLSLVLSFFLFLFFLVCNFLAFFLSNSWWLTRFILSCSVSGFQDGFHGKLSRYGKWNIHSRKALLCLWFLLFFSSSFMSRTTTWPFTLSLPQLDWTIHFHVLWDNDEPEKERTSTSTVQWPSRGLYLFIASSASSPENELLSPHSLPGSWDKLC